MKLLLFITRLVTDIDNGFMQFHHNMVGVCVTILCTYIMQIELKLN